VGGACSTYGERRGAYRVLVGKLRERDHLKDLIVDGKIILQRIFKKWNGEAWPGLIWIRIRRGGGRL
jgi:hypothetical protein